MEDEEQVIEQRKPPLMASVPFRPRSSNWDLVTPFTSDEPSLPCPPPRMRPRPKPSDMVDCLPDDIERLSLPVLTAQDLMNNPIKPPPLPANMKRRRISEEFSKTVAGKRTRPQEQDNAFCKSATFQYPGISGRTIYADPIARTTESEDDDDIITTCSEKKRMVQDEDFYFPMPRFTPATRSALPHMLQLSK